MQWYDPEVVASMGQNLSRVTHIKRELVFQWNFNTARVTLVPATIKTIQRGRLERKGYK